MLQRRLATVCALGLVFTLPLSGRGPRTDLLDARISGLTRDTAWKPVAAIPIAFRTYHPQGLVRIGDAFIISSVEMRRPTRRFAQREGGFDRDAGEGVGHLFKVDSAGRLVSDRILGEGDIYHPGGIDFDGTDIWVPVAQYRPDSRSIVYRVDPQTMRAREMLRAADHIGAVVHDTDAHALHGVSWGSRRFYQWMLDGEGRVTNADSPRRLLNPSHYVDYQDCKYAGSGRMVCTGVADLRRAPGEPPFHLGGIDLVSLDDGRPLHQVPVQLWTSGGLSMTRNAAWLEPRAGGLRAYLMPDDERSTVYVYDAEIGTDAR